MIESEVNRMWLNINPRASDPIYLQIIRGIKSAVARGLLSPGEKLASVRELATELTVNHNTVARAYQELERDRVIEVIVGRGTFVSLNPIPPNYEERVIKIQNDVKTMLVEAHHLGMTAAGFLEMVRGIVEEWNVTEEVQKDDQRN
ncbi:GntR family transcriptional regulator [Alicyclobacillus sp. SO9]|uniref:GntR family transcriptional regulator n=1 Tax=Alicyclobacillus sp. SO9 TaxID=2665646 RepID=UPI0018E79416|nr:GntR family transcriptional regulator [Alicyclobacillus sp. SO9]QQE78294.1 GntR family transcriptional regulator [Alicyclobacillus sp. SO9]